MLADLKPEARLVSHCYHISITEEAVSCLLWQSDTSCISQCIHDPQCDERADLFDEMSPSQSDKIYCQSITGVRKRHMAPVQVGNETKQQCSSSVLRHLLLLLLTELPSAPTVSQHTHTCGWMWIDESFISWRVCQEYKTYSVSHWRGSLVGPVVRRCTSWPPPPPPFPYRVTNQTSACQKCQAAFLPCNAHLLSFFIHTHIKELVFTRDFIFGRNFPALF